MSNVGNPASLLSDYWLVEELIRRGVSPRGSQQLVAGEIVASPDDRFRLGRLVAMNADSADPSGNTIYVGGAGGGVWKTSNQLSSLGVLQFSGSQPVTDLGDRRRLAKIFAEALGGPASRTRAPWRP